MRPKSASSVRSLRAVGCSAQASCSLQSLIVGRGSWLCAVQALSMAACGAMRDGRTHGRRVFI